MIFSLPTGDKLQEKKLTLYITQALCNLTFRALATQEASMLFQRQVQNVVEKNRLYFRKTLTLQKREGILPIDSITDEVY